MPRHHTKPHSREMAVFFKSLGVQVSTHREKQKLSQAEVSEMADIGIRHYQDLEAGHIVSLRLVWSVAKALKITVSKLTQGLGPDHKEQ